MHGICWHAPMKVAPTGSRYALLMLLGIDGPGSGYHRSDDTLQSQCIAAFRIESIQLRCAPPRARSTRSRDACVSEDDLRRELATLANARGRNSSDGSRGPRRRPRSLAIRGHAATWASGGSHDLSAPCGETVEINVQGRHNKQRDNCRECQAANDRPCHRVVRRSVSTDLRSTHGERRKAHDRCCHRHENRS